MNELQAFEKRLRENEKSPATIEKYLRDARAFLCWLDGREPTKELTVCYKEGLTERYEAASVNSMLAGINSYLSFSGRADCRVKPLRVQRTLFGSEERELSREEYARLVRAALRRTGVPFFSPRYSRTAAGTVAAYSFSSCSLSRMSSCSFLFAR